MFIGRTGSGKTTLARALLQSASGPWVVLDPKSRYSAPDTPVVLAYNPSLRHQIIRKPYVADSEPFDPDLAAIYARGQPVTVYADEVAMVTRARPVSVPLGALIRTGREPGMAVWSATQRPREVPAICFTESEHIFVFHLTDARDRDRVGEFTGDRVRAALERIRGHEFVYYHVESDKSVRTQLRL